MGDGAWKLGLALVAAPVAVVGGLSWLLATWAGSWAAPFVAAALAVPVAILTVWTTRARTGMFLLTTSFAAAAMIHWFGAPASLEYRESSGASSQVSAEPVPVVTQSAG